MATSSLYLFTYNNYMNKIVKKSDTLQGYGKPMVTLRNTQFNPNDHIRTSHIFNTFSMDERGIPDYCVVCDASDKILSRWYVIDVSRTRGGQWRVQLLADLAADYLSEMMDATCFIQKGYTNSSPFVFNNENMGFNQILSDLIPLENRLKTPWLVLYLARYKNAEEGNDNIIFNTFSGEFSDEPTTRETDYVLENLSDYKYYYYSLESYIAYDPSKIFFGAEYKMANDQEVYEMTQESISGDSGFKPRGIYDESLYMPQPSQVFPTFPAGTVLRGEAMNWGNMAGLFSNGFYIPHGLPINSYTASPVQWYYGQPIAPAYLGTSSGHETLMEENGKTIKIGDQIYRIEIIQENPPLSSEGVYKISPNSDLGQEMRGDFFYYNDLYDIPSNAIQNYYVHIPLTFPKLRVHFVEVGSGIESNPISYNFGYKKSITQDASYEIIAAPYNSITFTTIPGQTGSFTHNGDIALQWFQAIVNKYNGAKFAYDLQLLPYCPVDTLDLSAQNVIFAERGDAKLALAIQLDRSNFSAQFKIQRFPWNEDLKLSNELDLYRLVSPNGVGEYEWTPVKNGTPIGTLPLFEVDCTLIPFNPYIKINPYFGGLYGQDYNDYRGLRCGGDFSLPIVNNEWETYQLNNKYYQNIFDRTIEHQEFNNKYARISDTVNAVTGTLQGASQGGMAGGLVGGLLGAGIGTILGGAASAAGGVADIQINEKLRTESLDYQKDKFGFELGTIKARAQSLTRTTSFNKNNKYFPYIEYYTCTEQEKKALKNKMKYNGMTIGVIGTIPEYLNTADDFTFVQGTIIEIDISSNAAIVERLNQILQGGIRIKNG